ncbi:MAG: hypothetical protein ACREIA_10030 [Opitutaceae bacterium]
MPQIQRVVHQGDRQTGFEPPRQSQCGQEAEVAAIHCTRERGHDRPLREERRCLRQPRDGEIARLTPPFRLGGATQRMTPFENEQRR